MQTELPTFPARRFPARAGSLLAASLLCLSTVPSAASAGSAPETIRISGSSTVFPITAAAIRSFRQSDPGRSVRFELKETGTTAGFRDFCSGVVAISNASRPINSQELKACAARGIHFIELPIAFDALTVVVPTRNSWARMITLKELSRLWSRQAQARVLRWNQVNIDWPASPIRLCGPGRDSGSFDYFNKAINGDPDNSRSDVTTSEDDAELVKCVANDPQALGYFGFGWYSANRTRLRALAVVGAKGPVEPSLASVQNGRYTPLSRPLFLYINNQAMLSRPEVQRFATYSVRKGQEFVTAAGFIPLPASTYRLVEAKLYRHVLGTSFGGDLPIGLTIGQALARSFDAIRRPEFR